MPFLLFLVQHLFLAYSQVYVLPQLSLDNCSIILLEVDPVSSDDPESAKPVRFHEKQNFKKAPSIHYERIHPITVEKNVMDIYYWSDSRHSDQWLMEKMKDVYEEVHAFKNHELYDKKPQPSSQVLQLKQYNASKAE